jgi:hypothetical protein
VEKKSKNVIQWKGSGGEKNLSPANIYGLSRAQVSESTSYDETDKKKSVERMTLREEIKAMVKEEEHLEVSANIGAE